MIQFCNEQSTYNLLPVPRIAKSRDLKIFQSNNYLPGPQQVNIRSTPLT